MENFLRTSFMFLVFSVLTVESFGQELTPANRPAFKVKQIQVAGHKIKVEIADDDEKREYGLMFKKNLPPNQGMLFIFEKPHMLRFWMKNTLIPLSIAYISADKKIVTILEMVPASPVVLEPPTYPSEKPAQYALEMNPGWFKKNKVGVGAKLVID